jgi:hypothetical protein
MKNKNHIKQYLVLLFILFTHINFAQISKTQTGSYSQGSTAGIYIYEDGTFALFGYATLVFGEYKIDKDQIHFIPNIPKQAFTILGRDNKKIKDENGAKFTFNSDFITDGPTYINIDESGFMKISGDDFNGGDSHYTINFPKKPTTITLALDSSDHKHNHNTNAFNFDGKYNEYLLFFNPTISEQKPFWGNFETKEGINILECDWGTFKKDKKEETEMIEFLNQYKKEQQKNKDQKVVYFNDQLKKATGYNHLSEQENIFDINNYIFDETSNKFIHKDIYKKEENYLHTLAQDYHDENIILQYHKIEVSSKTNTNFSNITISKNTLFPSNATEKSKEEKMLDNSNPVEVEEQYPVKTIPVKSKKKNKKRVK